MERFGYSKDCNWLYSDTEAYLWYDSVYVRIVYREETLSSKILNFERDLPEYGKNLLIDGDRVSE